MSTDLIQHFYRALQRRDAATMAACYHDEARFSDPVFPDLDAVGVRAMWTMLLTSSQDLRVEFGAVEADATHGRAHWDARYTFSASGRRVLNRVDAQFEFRDGRILVHRDRFSFRRWAGQALGVPGYLFGGSAWLQRKVQRQAAQRLAAWQLRHPAGALTER